MRHILMIGLSLTGAALLNTAAFAQVDLRLLTEPWGDSPRFAETQDELVYILEGRDDRTGQDIQVFDWDSFGRVKFDRQENDPAWWLGYRLRSIEISRDIVGFPTGLTDLAVAAAVPFKRSDTEWSAGLIVGAGTANDNHFRNSDALYGIAALNFSKSLTADRTLHLGIDYRGNRVLWPDVPLPYAMLSERLNEDFSYRVGLPFSGLSWDITDSVVLDLEYAFPLNLSAEARFQISDEFNLFADYRRTIDGFHREDSDTQRIFYEYDRVEVGVRWIKEPMIDVSLGVGYAFGQEFSRGWDIRDLDTVAEPSDEMLVSLTLRGAF